MKTIKIVPSVCSELESKWSGHVTLKPLSFDDRYELFENLSIGFNDDGDVDLAKTDRIKTMRKMVKASEKLYVEVDLKHTDGTEVKSFEEMQYIDDLHPVLVEVATKMINGFKVGNG